MNLKKLIKNNYYISYIFFIAKWKLPAIIWGDKRRIEKFFLKAHGYIPDIDNPKTVNEKIQWLKLYDRKPIYTGLVDKIEVKKYFADRFGEEYVVPNIKIYSSWRDIKAENLPDEPFVLKSNTGTGTWRIIRDKNRIEIRQLRTECRKWVALNHYYASQEWQYKNVPAKLFAEILLTDENGNIPYDYKLHFMGGELQFIYCVVDREGENYRAMFSPDWDLLPFQWVSKRNYKEIPHNINEKRPRNLDKMISFGRTIAREFEFKYVRVDFYECDDKLYFGEITLYHGSGMNQFYPPEAELNYIDKIDLAVRK